VFGPSSSFVSLFWEAERVFGIKYFQLDVFLVISFKGPYERIGSPLSSRSSASEGRASGGWRSEHS
jgi:hypothetical protein